LISVDEIAKFDFDRKDLVRRIMENEQDRLFVIDQILSNPQIMVYYQCFYLLQDATEQCPQLFYGHWTRISTLLYHKNSYHRDIAITLLANLIVVDENNNFDGIYNDYLNILFDPKFKTAVSCINNLRKILVIRHDKIPLVFNVLLEHKDKSKFSEKQEEYIHGEICLLFDLIIEQLNIQDRNQAQDFIFHGVNSKSPKTRKICKAIVKRRNLTTGST
jgi:hypothetical protein